MLKPQSHSPDRPFSVAYFCYFIFVGAWIAFWPLWLDEQGFNAEQIGTLVACALATKIFAPSIWGFVADYKAQHLWCLRLCAIAGFISFLFVFLQQSFLALLCVVLAFSFFWNAVMPQIEVLTLSVLESQNRQSYYTQIRVWGSIAFTLCVVFLGWLFDQVSIRYLPFILALSLLFIIISAFYIRPAKTTKRSQISPQLSSVLKQPGVIAFFVVCFLIQASHGPYYTFFSVYLQDLGYSKQSIGWLWSLGVVAEIILYFYMRRVFERFSLHLILSFSLLLTVLRWLIMANYAHLVSWVIFAQLLHAFSYGAYHAVGVILIRKFFSGGNEATGMGLYSGVSFGAGGTLGAYLSGIIWNYSPWLCFSAAALCAFIGLFVAWFFVERPNSAQA